MKGFYEGVAGHSVLNEIVGIKVMPKIKPEWYDRLFIDGNPPTARWVPPEKMPHVVQQKKGMRHAYMERCRISPGMSF